MPMTPILAPETIAELLIRPVEATAVATRTSTVVHTDSRTWRCPVVTADPSASWVLEGQEIEVSDADLDEIEVTPAKLAGLTIVSRELADDTSPEAQEVIGDGLARDIARKLDLAYLQTVPSPAPPGLTSITPTSLATPDNGFTNLDVFAQATSAAEDEGANITAWIASPSRTLSLATLKDQAGSNRPLLGASNPEQPATRTIEGRPLYPSPACPSNVVWGIDESRVFTIIRQDWRIDVDASAFFTSDRVAVRATMRVGFGFPHEAAVVAIHPGT